MYTLYPAITSQASTTSIASCVIFCLAPGPSPTIYNSFLLSAFMLLSIVALLSCFYVLPGLYCSSLSCFSFRFPSSASGFGFFRPFFGFQTHFVGFFACFLLATHRLPPTSLIQLPFLGFFVCFSIPTPTTWVFLLAFHSLHPDCSSLS